MKIRKPKPAELTTVIHFIYIHSQDASTASLYCYQTYSDIEKEITWLFDQGHPFLGAFENDKLLDIVFGFQVPNQNRIDVSGPFLTRFGMQANADVLLSCFLNDHPLKTLYFYFEGANKGLAELLMKHGAVDQGDEYRMQINRDQCKTCRPSSSIRSIINTEKMSFVKMFRHTMGTLYISGEEILNDNNRIVQLYHKDSSICGFIVLKHPSHESAIIEMIGIDERFQNQGLGHILLSHALFTLCNTFNPHVIELIVDAANTRALHLYESFGFQIIKKHKSYILI